MKKIIIIIILITIVSTMKDIVKQELVIIPKESIRLRVIANSDSDDDQKLKMKVTENLEKNINSILLNSKTIEQSRENINKNMLTINNNVKTTLEQENCNLEYEISFGKNYFPEKKYKGVVYKEGNYESLVVTLGKGHGKNFWCVLFPPLCLLDEKSSNEKIEYHFLVTDILNKYKKTAKKNIK